MTSITVYDGNNTIGGTKIYVEENGSGVFLDFGANFTDYDKFLDISHNYIIIPVHTDNPKWFVEKYGDIVKIPEKGIRVL